MKIDDNIEDQILQYDINREVAKIPALSSRKIDKYEYLTGEEILSSNQKQIIEQAKFTCSPLGKVFEKQTTTIEEQGIKQIDAITNQNEILVYTVLTIKDDHKDIYKEIFDEIKDLTYEINDDYLTYYFEDDTAKKKFDDFNNGVERFKKL